MRLGCEASNESPVNVFFDNLQVVHTRSAILEETHYYPFGLTMTGISSKALAFGKENKKNKFQNQEFNDDLGVNYYECKWRHHDPQIGRFIQIDPLADEYEYNSTYAFSENKVTNHIELEGLESVPLARDLWTQAQALPPQAKVAAGIAAGIVFLGELVWEGVKASVEAGGTNNSMTLIPESMNRDVMKTYTKDGTNTVSDKPKIDKEALDRGRANEKKTLADEKLDKNTTPVTVKDPKTGKDVTTIPDANKPSGATVDVKDVKKLSDLKQLRAQSAASAQKGQKAP